MVKIFIFIPVRAVIVNLGKSGNLSDLIIKGYHTIVRKPCLCSCAHAQIKNIDYNYFAMCAKFKNHVRCFWIRLRQLFRCKIGFFHFIAVCYFRKLHWDIIGNCFCFDKQLMGEKKLRSSIRVQHSRTTLRVWSILITFPFHLSKNVWIDI